MNEKNQSSFCHNEEYFPRSLDHKEYHCYKEFDVEDYTMKLRFFQQKVSSMSELVIWDCGIEDQGCVVLSRALQQTKSLRSLKFGWNRIGINGCRAFSNAIHNMSSLKVLDLNSNNIGDDECSVLIEGIGINSPIEELVLSGNNIGNNGCLYLSNMIKNNYSLTGLYLYDNQIGDNGCKALALALRKNSTLQVLSLSRNSNITKIGWEELINVLFNYNTTLHTIYYSGTRPKKIDLYLILNRIGRKKFLETSDMSAILKAASLAEHSISALYELLRSKPDNWFDIKKKI